jgi:hypothetical protein
MPKKSKKDLEKGNLSLSKDVEKQEEERLRLLEGDLLSLTL